MSDCTVVLIKRDGCRHSDDVVAIWDSTVAELTKLYPLLRFHTVDIKSLNEGSSLKYLSQYRLWFPTILLIPSNLWVTAMQNPTSQVDIVEGVQIMNGDWVNDNSYKYVDKYNNKQSKDIIKWVKDCID